MEFGRCAIVAAALVIFCAPNAECLDFSKVTCQVFITSGQANMAAMIMFLRGYHAGRVGVIPYHSDDHYGGKLGFYCRQHPSANLIEGSEHILTDLDRGR